MILILIFLLTAVWLQTVVFYQASRWCLNKRRKVLVLLALAVLGAGAVYGLLRLTGVIILPSDNTWSVNFFDASWRDDGVRLLILCGGPFAGAAALMAGRKER